MANYKELTLIFIVIILASYGCIFDDDHKNPFDWEKGYGEVITKTLDITGFTGIELERPEDVFITQGEAYSVIVKGQENIIDLLKMDVIDGVWEIDFTSFVRNYEKLEFFITMPEIEYLEVSGSGLIRGENTFKTLDIELKLDGSGDMDLGLEADDITGKISGSGKMFLEGITQKLDFKISGSGDLRAFDLVADRADVNISGSGDMEIHVIDDLDIRITGSGDVFYKGNPNLNVSITGSGNVINAN